MLKSKQLLQLTRRELDDHQTSDVQVSASFGLSGARGLSHLSVSHALSVSP